MVAQTVTNRMHKTQIARLANLQRLAANAAPVDIDANATTTVTLVYTTATGAITIDYAAT